jgi:hypothetical protein
VARRCRELIDPCAPQLFKSLPAKYFETGPIWAEALRKAELPA